MKWLRSIAWTILILAAVALTLRLLMPIPARLLIRSDALGRADAIVVLSSGRLERTFEAATLVREGWSRHVFLLRSPDFADERLLKKLNVRIPMRIDVQKDVLAQMGVPATAVQVSPMTLENTRAEAEFASAWAKRQGWKRMIVVTSPYHTARAGRYFRAAAHGSFDVIMRSNRYEAADPNQWWRHHTDRHDVVFEVLKAIHGLMPSGS